jgi:hypothetical protein
MQISRVLSLFGSSIVSYIVSYLGLGLVLGTELVLDSGSGFFKYSSYNWILVLLISLYYKLKLLCSFRRYSARD